MPTNSDLVTDLPADFEVFGQAVDTSLADLKGGTTGQVLSKASNTDMDFTWSNDAGISPTIFDAKADLLTATAADTPARLAVGTNGQYLQADSSTATGLKWASISAGAMTSIASGSLSGVTVIISSIPQTYKQLILYVRDYTNSSGAANYSVYFNNTTSTYTSTVISKGTVASTSAGSGGIGFTNAATSAGTRENRSVIFIPDYADNTAMQPVYISTIHYDSVAAGNREAFVAGQFSSGAGVAITDIYLKADGYSFSGGTYELFGVK